VVLILEVTGPQAAQLGANYRKVFGTEGGLIGRDTRNSWVLPHTRVSGRHARILYQNGVFYIEDTSTNGVFMNGAKSRVGKGRSFALTSGDTIFIDPYTISVTISRSAYAEPPGRRYSPVPAPRPLHDPFPPDDPFAGQSVPHGDFRVPYADDPHPDPVAGHEVDPLKLLGGEDPIPQAPQRRPPSAQDLERASPLQAHYQPPRVLTPTPPPAPIPDAPVADPFAIPEDYDPLAPATKYRIDAPSPQPPRAEPQPPPHQHHVPARPQHHVPGGDLPQPPAMHPPQMPQMPSMPPSVPPTYQPQTPPRYQPHVPPMHQHPVPPVHEPHVPAPDQSQLPPMHQPQVPPVQAQMPGAYPPPSSPLHQQVPQAPPFEIDDLAGLAPPSDPLAVAPPVARDTPPPEAPTAAPQAPPPLRPMVPSLSQPAGSSSSRHTPVPHQAESPSSQPAPPAAGPERLTLDLGTVLQGAGLDPEDVTPDLARDFGRILRVVVSGVMEVLQARHNVKDEFRMRVTQFRPVDNNPLKFSANVDDALHNLLVKRNPAYLKPVEAFDDAFDDLRYHQLAMLAGMRTAFEAMLNGFHPERLQEQFDRQVKRGALLAVGSKLRYWDAYRDMYEELSKDPEVAFRTLFGDAFAKAYEEQLQRLKAQNTRPGARKSDTEPDN
jgi:type VI secretion system FHA domain protein